jgi:hypothetical protein
MATLAPQLFTKAEDNKDDEDQLLKLFWNRAELKKELDKLRDQTFRLTEKGKQQEAITLRVQQRLGQLEASLGDPENAETVVAYYQLLALWNHCHARLASFASDLERAQNDKDKRQHTASFKRQINESLVAVKQELKEANENADLLAVKTYALREKRSERRGIWNFFRRRGLTTEIKACRQERRTTGLHIDGLSEGIELRLSQEMPEYGGLDVATKRSINITVIAYAQELFLHFFDRDLAKNMREAAIRQFMDVSYGSKRDCRALSKYAEDRMKLLATDNKLQSRVQIRAQGLPTLVQYRQDTDTVPDAATLGVVALLKADGRQRGEVSVNILAEEYWDIFSVLLT